jgi:hypothetical protein
LEGHFGPERPKPAGEDGRDDSREDGRKEVREEDREEDRFPGRPVASSAETMIASIASEHAWIVCVRSASSKPPRIISMAAPCSSDQIASIIRECSRGLPPSRCASRSRIRLNEGQGSYSEGGLATPSNKTS